MTKIFFLLPVVLLYFNAQAQHTNYNLLIGTYTNSGKSEGIYTYNFNSLNGETTLKSTTKNVDNPSFLAISPDHKSVYSVNESGSKSAVSAFNYNPVSAELKLLNKKDSEGADPCYVTADNKNVIVGNYSGGTIAVYGRNPDGSLTDAKQVIQHTGKSIDPKRQESAHVHMVQFTPDKNFLICNDLGEDMVYIYNYYPLAKTQVLSLKTAYQTKAGTGPRHLTFSPNGKFAYLTHEFNGSITAFSYSNGNLNRIQEIGTTEADFTGEVSAADIHVSPDGKFLYQSNRGDLNTISVFSIFPTGKLAFVSRVSTLGDGPRNFAIDPSGKYLLVGNQKSNEVVIFNRDQATGALTDSGKRIAVAAPVCLVFDQIE
jgi:6-phosphogluconolactonase